MANVYRPVHGGSRGGARKAPLPYFLTKLRPEGPKKHFFSLRPLPSLSQSLKERPPIGRSASATADYVLYLRKIIENKLSKFFYEFSGNTEDFNYYS